MGAWRELWATWGGGQRWIPGQKSRGLRPAPGVPLVYCQSVDQLPLRFSESEPAEQGWKSDDVSGSAPVPGSAVLL